MKNTFTAKFNVSPVFIASFLLLVCVAVLASAMPLLADASKASAAPYQDTTQKLAEPPILIALSAIPEAQFTPASQFELITSYQKEAILTLRYAQQSEQIHTLMQNAPENSTAYFVLETQYNAARAAFDRQLDIELAALRSASVNDMPSGETLAALREMLGLDI